MNCEDKKLMGFDNELKDVKLLIEIHFELETDIIFSFIDKKDNENWNSSKSMLKIKVIKIKCI